MTTRELSRHLGVSTSWVTERAVMLGGTKDERGWWVFPTSARTNAMHVLRAAGDPELVVRCPDCGREEVVKKGRYGQIVIEQRHVIACEEAA